MSFLVNCQDNELGAFNWYLDCNDKKDVSKRRRYTCSLYKGILSTYLYVLVCTESRSPCFNLGIRSTRGAAFDICFKVKFIMI
jgi:hypothetical protein